MTPGRVNHTQHVVSFREKKKTHTHKTNNTCGLITVREELHENLLSYDACVVDDGLATGIHVEAFSFSLYEPIA